MSFSTSAEKNQIIRQWAGLCIAGAVVGISVGAIATTAGASPVLLLGGLALVVAGWLIVMARRARQDWLAPPVLFLVAVVLYYVVRPVSLALGMQPIGQKTSHHIHTALGLVALTVLGFAWGYKLRGSKIIARWIPQAASGWGQRRVAVAIGGLWVLGMACWVLLMWRSGGVAARFAGYGTGLAVGQGVLVVLSAAGLALALTLAWMQYLWGNVGRLAMVAVAIMTVPMLAMHGQRSALLVPLLMTVTIYHYQCQRLSLRSLAIIGLVVMMISVALALPRLQLAAWAMAPPHALAYARMAGWLLVRNLTSFDALMVAAGGVPQRIDYQWGRGYLDALAMMVPRWLYADKPMRNLFNRVLRPGRTTSMALPPAGEGYLNFGWGGALLESVLLGLIYGVAYAYRRQHPANEGALFTYAFSVAFFMIIFRGGLMGGHIGLLIVCLVLIALVTIFCARGRLLVKT